MAILRNILFLLMFVSFIAILFFMAGTFLVVGILLLPLMLLGGMKIRKFEVKTETPQAKPAEKILEAEFTRVE